MSMLLRTGSLCSRHSSFMLCTISPCISYEILWGKYMKIAIFFFIVRISKYLNNTCFLETDLQWKIFFLP